MKMNVNYLLAYLVTLFAGDDVDYNDVNEHF